MKQESGKTFWIVSCPENTLFQGSEKEYYYHYEAALAAARRLAREFPGNMFLVMQAVSVSYVPEPRTYIFSEKTEETLREELSGLLWGQELREMRKTRSAAEDFTKNLIRVV